MIDFFATWCGPCKMLGPVMEQLADRYDGKAVVAKVDVDEQQMLFQRLSEESFRTFRALAAAAL